MPRPKNPRRLLFNPNVYYFKPRGVPLRFLDEINLERDEVEALKLYDFDGLDQKSAAEKLGVSQPTFARIIKRSHKKIANAIINGKAIKIDKPL